MGKIKKTLKRMSKRQAKPSWIWIPLEAKVMDPNRRDRFTIMLKGAYAKAYFIPRRVWKLE